jgi:DNA-binding winged helix-turn-helix (wHTH) protein/tetratricopeptide (TPR) repeat protein
VRIEEAVPRDHQISFPPFRLDTANEQLWCDDREISLRPKAFEVLLYLAEHPGQLVTKSALLDAIWAGISVGDSMPATCVAELRRALRDDARTPRFIETVHRRGYRFIARMTTTAATPEATTRKRLQRPQIPKPIMVGREMELAQLQNWYSQVVEGRRLVLFVAGEAGIGKTTFVEAFLDSIAQDGVARVGRGQCVEQYGSGEPYMPVLEALSRLSRESEGEQVIEVLNQFAPTWLAQMPELLTREERLRLQSEMLSVTQQRMLREMTQGLEALAAETPLVLLLEDLHWCDFSTLELISAIARRSEPARILIVGTYRPVEILATDHPLRTMKQELELHRYCRELRLQLLSQQNVVDYLARRLVNNGSRQFSTLAPVIHARTDGNPLFMSNMVDYLLLDAGLLTNSPAASEAEWAETLRTHRLDALRGIRQMIERNLERLKPDEQAVLESASVAGAEFSAATVAAALGRPQNEVEACCMRLSRREQFVSELGPVAWPDGTVATGFRFHHTLYQEVLYGRLSIGHQVDLHRLIAMREEAGYGERAGEVATELAYHYGRANDKSKAIQYLGLAAQRASKRGATLEAKGTYEKAFNLLNALPESPDRDLLELELRQSLVSFLQVTQGWAASNTRKAGERIAALAQKTGSLVQVSNALARQSFDAWMAGNLSDAAKLADEALELAVRDGRPRVLANRYMLQLTVRHQRGDLIGVEEDFRRGSAFFEDTSFKNDRGGAYLAAFGWASWNAWALGRPAIARERCATMMAGVNHSVPHHVGFSGIYAAVLHDYLGEYEHSEKLAHDVVELCERSELPHHTAQARCVLGLARMRLGRAVDGVKQIREGIDRLLQIGSRGITSPYLAYLATAQLTASQPGDAFETIEEALQVNPEELAYRPEMFRLRGEIRLSLKRIDLAETDFRDAIALAQRMKANAWQLRATTSLARLLAKQGRRDEAHTKLAEIYNFFTEGFETADLKEAKALLDEISTPLPPTRRSR